MISTESPNVSWNEIQGLDATKESLTESILMPLMFPDLYKGARTPQSIGTLLYGPPGNGKTLLAQACATQCEGQFFCLDLGNMLGQSTLEIRQVVKRTFTMAKESGPAVVFLDNMEVLTENEDEKQTTLR